MPVATDKTLAAIEGHLSPRPGETTGYIEPDDVVNSFKEILIDLSKVEGALPPQTAGVVATLLHHIQPSNQSMLDLYEDMAGIVHRWQANVDANPSVDKKAKGMFTPVGGEANPTTVAQTVVVLNNLIAALEETGIIRDVRGTVNQAPTAPVPPTGIQAPTAPSVVWTFLPANATVPADLTTLKGDAAVGDAALSGAGQAAFPRDQYIVLGDGSRASFDGTNWSRWTPVLVGLIPPTGVGQVQWYFDPPGATPPADLAALSADPTVGNTALQTANQPPFTTSQFIVLGDNSRAHYGVDPAGAPNIYVWVQGTAP